MARIQMCFSGDYWANRDQVIQSIAASSGEKKLIFEVNTEGPSLKALGVIDTIQEEISKIGLSDSDVWIDKWHNSVEDIPFERLYRPIVSHFFCMSDRYRFQEPDPVPREKIFALFVGRATPERAVIMYDQYHVMSDITLTSLMEANGHEYLLKQDFSDWIPDQNSRFAIVNWFHDCPVRSITGHQVRDQYSPEKNTNLDLVKHYNRFAIEIVCETYCRGDTFFPTEKTIRPISQRKPFLVYGPRYFLRRLRDMGFLTFGDAWDESYDDLEGAERWAAMKQQIGRIVNNKMWEHYLMKPIVDINLARLEYIIQKHKPGRT